jgi:hypothetical protein
MPELPGTYEWSFQASDLCTTVMTNVSVTAHCPQKPTARAAVSPAVVMQGKKATLSSDASVANWIGGKIVSRTWIVLSAPVGSGYEPNQIVNPTANALEFVTNELSVAGNYQFKLVVSDGCSNGETTACFEVKCNCGPTANAGATSTVWTNTPAMFNAGNTSAGDNAVTDKTSFTLDGSLSYDFDKSETLTYSWDFIEWEAAFQTPRTFSLDRNVAASLTSPGFMTYAYPPTGGGASTFSKKYAFVLEPQLVAQETVYEPAAPVGTALPDMASGATAAAGFPRTFPEYIVTEEDFHSPTTSWHAEIARTIGTVTTVKQFKQTKATKIPVTSVGRTYCSIEIRQRPVAATSSSGFTAAQNNPVASLFVSSFYDCRGLWSFGLRVTDGCGAITASNDTIKLNVRCNEPPVAVAFCNTTILWTGSAFDQVRLDGRGSGDPDTRELTYSWAFAQSPAGHCPQTHGPCVESYCADTANVITGWGAAGPQVNWGATSLPGCAPTKFTRLFRRDSPQPLGGYAMIPETAFHVGNSAYFTPKAAGTYTVTLTVNDGCSSSEAQVSVFAVCPALTVRFTMDRGSGVKQPNQAVRVNVAGAYTYPSSASSSALSYQWSVTPAGSIMTSTSIDTSIDFLEAGQFSITFTISDECQTVSATQTFTAQCNPSPAQTTLALTGPLASAGTSFVYYTGLQFPEVTLTAAAQDTDPLFFNFAMPQSLNTRTVPLSQGPRDNVISFTPTYTGEKTSQWTVQVVANDGCSSGATKLFQLNVMCNGTLTAVPGAAQTVVYNPGNTVNPFPSATFDGSASSDPYAAVSGHRTAYKWEVEYFSSSTAAAETVPSSRYAGASTSLFVVNANKVGSYKVSLTVNDGCTTSTTTTTLATRCTTLTQALIRPTPTNRLVQWNSFLTAAAGGFPEVVLDGTGSTGYSAVPLSYTWGYGPSNPQNPAVVLSSTQAPEVRFRPSQQGTFTFLLSVRNGPCPASPTTSVSITASCNRLVARIADSTGASNPDANLAPSVWDGTKFPLVTLDGMGSEYVQLGGAAETNGNRNRLSYTWTMVQSPAGSAYLAENSGSNNVIISTPAATRQDDPEVFVSANATMMVYNVTYREYTAKVTTSTVTTLVNHHYNRPHTCFKPDVPGVYRVVLRIADGCAVSTATASVVVTCKTAPSVSVKPVPTVVLPGNVFKRVELDAVVTFAAGEFMSYQWSLTAKPSLSSLSTVACVVTGAAAASINNNQMPLASFVPDRAGIYEFSITVSDGCNAAVSATTSVVVQCASGMTVKNPVVTNQAINWRGYGHGSPNDANHLSDFGNQVFGLQGIAETSCKVLRTRWVLTKRTCSAPFALTGTPPPTPAPVAAGCPPSAVVCNWALVAEPCTLTTVNPGYLAPILRGRDNQPSTLSGGFVNVDTCVARFTPQHPGTYKLRLRVEDACSTANGMMNVVAKCSTTVTANAGLDKVSMFRCSAGSTYSWDRITLSSLSTTEFKPSIPETITDACPTVNYEGAQLTCNDDAKAKCCAPVTGGACCSIKCPMCPQCASCPACPSHGTVAGGFSPLSVVRDRALLAQAAEPPLAAYRALEAPTLLLPILGLVLASVAANVLLVRGIARKQAALVKEVVPEW